MLHDTGQTSESRASCTPEIEKAATKRGLDAAAAYERRWRRLNRHCSQHQSVPSSRLPSAQARASRSTPISAPRPQRPTSTKNSKKCGSPLNTAPMPSWTFQQRRSCRDPQNAHRGMPCRRRHRAAVRNGRQCQKQAEIHPRYHRRRDVRGHRAALRAGSRFSHPALRRHHAIGGAVQRSGPAGRRSEPRRHHHDGMDPPQQARKTPCTTSTTGFLTYAQSTTCASAWATPSGPARLPTRPTGSRSQELVILGELVKRARENNVGVFVEGPGHVPLNQVVANIQIAEDAVRQRAVLRAGPARHRRVARLRPYHLRPSAARSPAWPAPISSAM